MISSFVRPPSDGYPAELVELLAEDSNESAPEFWDDAVELLVDELSLELLLELLLLEVLSQAVTPKSRRVETIAMQGR